MNRKRSNENIMKIVEIDEKVKRLQLEISRLERERTRLDKERLNEMYEEEQTIWKRNLNFIGFNISTAEIILKKEHLFPFEKNFVSKIQSIIDGYC